MPNSRAAPRRPRRRRQPVATRRRSRRLMGAAVPQNCRSPQRPGDPVVVAGCLGRARHSPAATVPQRPLTHPDAPQGKPRSRRCRADQSRTDADEGSRTAPRMATPSPARLGHCAHATPRCRSPHLPTSHELLLTAEATQRELFNNDVEFSDFAASRQRPSTSRQSVAGESGPRCARSSTRTLPGEGSRAGSGPETTIRCPKFVQSDSERGALTGRDPRDRGLLAARRGRVGGAWWLSLRVAARLPGAGTEDRPWLSSCALRR